MAPWSNSIILTYICTCLALDQLRKTFKIEKNPPNEEEKKVKWLLESRKLVLHEPLVQLELAQ